MYDVRDLIIAAENKITGIQLNLAKGRAEASPRAAMPTVRDQFELIKWKRRHPGETGSPGKE